MTLGSCASGKKTAQTDYQYQQWLAQQGQQPQYQQPEQTKPKEVKRELDECILLADDANCSNLRQYGDAIGYVESVIMDEAIMKAQENMATFIESKIESMAKRFGENGVLNNDATTMTRFRSVSRRYSQAIIKDSRVIKRSIYDLPDGKIHVYVCIESTGSKAAASRDIVKGLSNEGYEKIKQAEAEATEELTKEFGNHGSE
jgi:hypothetical protein